jgi:hypothetical protein
MHLPKIHLPKIGRPRHGTVVAYVALFMALSSGAYAATGGTFILGHTNRANTVSTLARTGTNGPALKVLTRLSSNPPLAVNGHGKVTNLNADLLDGQSSAAFQLGAFTPLTMTNAWTGNCFGGGAPGYARVGRVVYLHGTMCRASASGLAAFTLPAAVRPSNTLWLAVNQCDAATGRIVISSSGSTSAQSDPQNANAASCFTSLAGVSYTLPY